MSFFLCFNLSWLIIFCLVIIIDYKKPKNLKNSITVNQHRNATSKVTAYGKTEK